MTNFTKKNLKDVADSAKKFDIKGHQMHHANQDLAVEQVGLSYQKSQANSGAPFGHYHSEQEEIYIVIDGGGTITLDKEMVSLAKLDAVRVGKEVTRSIKAGPDGMEYIVVGAPLTGNDKGTMVPFEKA